MEGLDRDKKKGKKVRSSEVAVGRSGRVGGLR